jgi:hypothetical protein
MVQPLVRNGRILPNTEQPTDYLLSYADSLIDDTSRELGMVPHELTNLVNAHLNTVRDILHILQQREGWRESGDGGYK